MSDDKRPRASSSSMIVRHRSFSVPPWQQHPRHLRVEQFNNSPRPLSERLACLRITMNAHPCCEVARFLATQREHRISADSSLPVDDRDDPVATGTGAGEEAGSGGMKLG